MSFLKNFEAIHIHTYDFMSFFCEIHYEVSIWCRGGTNSLGALVVQKFDE